MYPKDPVNKAKKWKIDIYPFRADVSHVIFSLSTWLIVYENSLMHSLIHQQGCRE